MQITSQQTYDATPQAVVAMLTDRGFLEELCHRAGAVEHEIDIAGNSTRVMLRIPAPDFARSIVGATLPVVQTIDWADAAGDGSRTGKVGIVSPGMPVQVDGTASVQPQGQQTTVTYTGELTVHIPLLGKALENQAAPMIKESLDVQQQVGTDWLKAHPQGTGSSSPDA